MAALPQVETYSVRTIPTQQPMEEEPLNSTDEKIRGLECVICLVTKPSEEMQTIFHKKSPEKTSNGEKQCEAHDKPKLCRTCVIQLNPKICPLCRDEFSLPQENPPPTPLLADGQIQQIINIQPPIAIAQNPPPGANIQARPIRWRIIPVLTVFGCLGSGLVCAITLILYVLIEEL